MENLQERLFPAVYVHDVNEVKRLIDLGVNVNFADKSGRTALHEASDRKFNSEIVKILLENGCEPNIKDKQGRTALHEAANTSFDNSDIVQILLEHGCKPDEKDTQGDTALHIAAKKGDKDAIQLLFNSDGNPNIKNNQGDTALHIASENGDEDAIQLLFNSGVNPNIKNNQGDTALHMSSDYGNVQAIRFFLDVGCKPNDRNKQGDTALHIAAKKNNEHAIQLFLKSGCNPNQTNDQGDTALHIAAKKNNEHAIQLFLKSGCNPNQTNDQGDTALHIAAKKNNEHAIQLFLKSGCNPNQTNDQGKTALHVAAANHWDINLDVIRLLLENGCKPDVKDEQGRTALHVAADNRWKMNLDVIRLLLENGCKPDEKDKQGDTAFHIAVEKDHGHAIQLFLQSGCNPNQTNDQGRTALHVVAGNHFKISLYVIRLLLENGCKPDDKDKQGRTALHVAADNRWMMNLDLIQLLLENGCKPDEKDKQGDTALHIAAEKNNEHAIQLLLQSGCNPNQTNDQGKTPYMIIQDKSFKFQHPDDRKEIERQLKILKEFEEYWQLGLPIEIKQLDKKSAKVFTSLLEEEGYEHYEARVMLAGEQGTGKTTIARYLVGEGPTKTRISTDGIQLYNGLSFIDRENEEWLHGKQDFTLSEVAISRSLRTDTSTSINVKEKEKTTYQDTSIHNSLSYPTLNTETISSSHITDTQQAFNDERIIEEKQITFKAANESSQDLFVESTDEIEHKEIPPSPDKLDENPMQKPDLCVSAKGKKEYAQTGTDRKSSESSITSEVVKNPGKIGMLKKLFGIEKHVEEIKVSMTDEKFLKESLKVGRKKIHHRKIVPVIIWDFGGQDVFYSTHQTFLTYRAIYLIVLDGHRNLDDPCPFEQYLPGKSGPKTARDYLRFWITTIVTYCKGSRTGFPKIMIVLTHKDKLKAVDVEPKRQQIFHEIEQMFSGSTLLSHLVIKDQIFVNARNAKDPEMSKIKNIIIEQAIEQPTWGQELPKCFIPLELEFDSLLRRNIPLITMEHMQRINSAQPVRLLTDVELKTFLKFQHSVGRILYFDEASLNQHIILSPTHLIDAFKSIVTDRKFCKGDKLRQDSWDLMSQKGVIAKKCVEDIWKKKNYKKFHEHKEYLLGVMTHLDILVEPKRYDNSHRSIPAEFYYVASMIKTNDTTGYMKSASFCQRNIAIAFSLPSSMIPPALSFRFLSYCLSMFAVKLYGQKNEEMLFHRSAVFTIDPSLDMCINCDDEIIIVRLVHVKNRTLIMRDLASSIRECLTVALEKISQLYIKTCSTESVVNEGSFSLSLCCSSSEAPCLLPIFKLKEQVCPWICPKHGIEHTKDVMSSWEVQQEGLQCGDACPVTDNAFLEQLPIDIHLRRLSMQYSINETKELAIYLGMQFGTWDDMYVTLYEEPERLKFETLRRCIGDSNKTFNDIRNAIELGKIQNQHTLCKVVRGNTIDFDKEPEKWDLIATEEHLDRVAPLVGNKSLPFLVELGMEFKTWEKIRYRQIEKDLVKLNRDILQEWRSVFCVSYQLRPSLRYIGQAFNNIDKNIKIIENVLADLF